MSAIIDRYIINNVEYDRRVKLTVEDKKEIKTVYKEGIFSQRELAEIYNVSRRSIQFAISTDKLKANKQRRAERGGSKQYYNKEQNSQTQREHRKYKKELLACGIELTRVA
ncbi:hypothetical protein [Candidatus Sulfurimonas baltica]|uniref:Uncharacterized protein n=1 Tax=Candidatus Sulfurimonas baltica TaxID=2740404 RepID=A0A7S7LWK0_9BACT|nr:hypothetical protein [Candidatus Sulfurimonas baltica]QOY52742.1 hypothetical protein HUE88_03390 [Candidatus Sulfurimonas baltica]